MSDEYLTNIYLNTNLNTRKKCCFIRQKAVALYLNYGELSDDNNSRPIIISQEHHNTFP